MPVLCTSLLCSVQSPEPAVNTDLIDGSLKCDTSGECVSWSTNEVANHCASVVQQ